MALPSTGPLSIGNIQTEFGGVSPARLGEYYANATYVPAGTSGVNGTIPTSGPLNIGIFRGTVATPPLTNRFSFWGTNSALPNIAGQTRVSYSSELTYLSSSNEATMFATRGITSVEEVCGTYRIFSPTGLTAIRVSGSGSLVSSTNYTWSGTDAPAGLKGENGGVPIRRQYGLRDSSGNIYLKGSVSNVNNRTSVIKLNPNMTVAWARHFLYYTSASNPPEYYTMMAVAKNGDLYLTGEGSIAVMKLNSSGIVQYATRYNYSTSWGIGGIGGDSLGNGYIAAQVGTTAIRLDKFNPSGDFVKGWSINIAQVSGARNATFVEDNDTNIYAIVTGYSTANSAYIFKFNSDFNLLWQRVFSVTTAYSWSQGFDAYVDSSNNLNVLVNTIFNDLRHFFRILADGTVSYTRTFNTRSHAASITQDAAGSKYVISGQLTERSDLAPATYASVSHNLALHVLQAPITSSLTSSSLSNGTNSGTIVVGTGGTISVGSRTLTASGALTRTARINTNAAMTVSTATTSPLPVKISEQILT